MHLEKRYLSLLSLWAIQVINDSCSQKERRRVANTDKGKSSKPSTRVSLATVAKHAGVSTATASRIVNGVTNKASNETILRVRASIDQLGYRPTSIGRALRRQESRIVGLLAATIANPTMAAIASSIEWALRAEGYVMSLCDTHELPEVQDEYLLEMQSLLVRAVIIVGAVESKQLDAMREAGVPVLFVNRPDPYNQSCAYVGMDNYQAGFDVAQTLIQKGIRRFGLIHASLSRTAASHRYQGFMDGITQAGCSLDDVVHVSSDGLNHLDIGYAAMGHYLDGAAHAFEKPRVIVCMSDILAYGAYRRAQEAELDPSLDFAFFGFDDNPLNYWLAPWLNSIGVPADSYGNACVDLLKDIWSGLEVTSPVYLPHSIRLSGL